MATNTEERFLCSAVLAGAIEAHIMAHGLEKTQRWVQDWLTENRPVLVGETTVAPVQELLAPSPGNRWADLEDDED